VVRSAADLVTVLDAGAIIAQGTPAQVARRKVVLDAYLGDAASQLFSRARTRSALGTGSTGNRRKTANRSTGAREASKTVRHSGKRSRGGGGPR
jgi:hypothetical protein